MHNYVLFPISNNGVSSAKVLLLGARMHKDSSHVTIPSVDCIILPQQLPLTLEKNMLLLLLINNNIFYFMKYILFDLPWDQGMVAAKPCHTQLTPVQESWEGDHVAETSSGELIGR